MRVRCLGVLALVAGLGLLGGCAAKPPKPAPPASLLLTASSDANPDPGGRPAPVVIRIYQLRSDSAFLNSDFFALFDDDHKVLAADFVGSEEAELSPGEVRHLDLILAPDTRFIGAIAAYRDIRNASWRALTAVPVAAPKKKPARLAIVVVAGRAQVTLEADR
jgi:type VI secretion system protein VasD